MRKLELFGLNFLVAGVQEAASLIIESAKKKEKEIIVTPNVDHIVQLEKDVEARQIFQAAQFVVADGMPLVWLSRITSGSNALPERINGTNLMFKLCEITSTQGLSVAFVGGKTGAAELAGKMMTTINPGLKVVGTYCPPFGFENSVDETLNLISLIDQWRPDILFFGVGMPKQEKWASKNKGSLNAGAILCVGSGIELAAGLVSRAPVWAQNIGLEWLWRLLMEPRRLWRRYLIQDMKFLGLAAGEIRSKYLSKNKLVNSGQKRP